MPLYIIVYLRYCPVGPRGMPCGARERVRRDPCAKASCTSTRDLGQEGSRTGSRHVDAAMELVELAPRARRAGGAREEGTEDGGGGTSCSQGRGNRSSLEPVNRSSRAMVQPPRVRRLLEFVERPDHRAHRQLMKSARRASLRRVPYFFFILGYSINRSRRSQKMVLLGK